jgi:hypothetical protein
MSGSESGYCWLIHEESSDAIDRYVPFAIYSACCDDAGYA